MEPRGWRPHIEDAFVLDLSAILRRFGANENFQTSGTLAFCSASGVVLLEVRTVVRLTDFGGEVSLSHVARDPDTDLLRTFDYCIHLETTRQHLGGRRWWFRCPVSGRRARKLYLYPGLAQFCHRDAIQPRPTYALQRVSGFDRVLAQRAALAAKFGQEPSYIGLRKPKRMRWKTFERYRRRDEELQERRDRYMDMPTGEI